MISMAQPLPPSGERPPGLQALAQLLTRMTAEGDARAAQAGRRARRTLQEMAPGYDRPPLLSLHRVGPGH